MIKKSGRVVILYWLIGILGAVCILGNLHKDRFVYDSVPAEITYPEVYQEEQNGLGVFAEGREFSLKKGAYTLEADVNSIDSEDILLVYAKTDISKENTLGKVLERIPAQAENGHITAKFTIDQDYDHVTVLLMGKKEAFAQSALYAYSLTSDKLIYGDTFFLTIVWIGLWILGHIFVIGRKDTVEWGERIWTLQQKQVLFFLTVTVLVSLPLFTDFLADSHDLGFHLNRIEGIAKALKTGQFPARINAVFNGGSGYPVEIMYPGLLLYIPALLRVCGVSLLLAFKVYCVLVNLLTVMISYTAFTKITDSRRIGALASILYTFSLYRIDNLLCRGAIGEWTAMAFLPLVLWGLWEVFYKEEKKWPILVLGITMVFQSHLISTLLCLMFCGVFGLASIGRLKKVSRWKALGAAAVAVILLNAFTIVPMFCFLRKGMSIAGQERFIGDYAAYLPQIFSNFIYNQQFAAGLGGTQHEMPITVGCIFLLGILLFVYAGYYRRDMERSFRKKGTVFLAGGLLAVLLASNLFPWDLVQSIPKVGRLCGMIQFPFRFLMLAVLCLAPVTAIAVDACLKQRKEAAVIMVLAACFVLSLFSFDGYLEQNETLMTNKFETCVEDKLGQDYVNLDYYDRNTDVQAVVNMDRRILANDETLRISGLQKEGVTMRFDYQKAAAAEVFLELPLYSVEGYEAREIHTGEKLTVTAGDGSRVRIYLPEALKGSIQVWYQAPFAFRVCDFLSAMTAIVGAAFVTCRILKQKKLKKE